MIFVAVVRKHLSEVEAAELVLMLTVLNEDHRLRDVEVKRSTPGNAQGVFRVVGIVGAAVHDRVHHEARAEGAELVGGAQGGVALVQGRMIGFGAVRAKRILSGNRETRKFRRHVGDGVVVAAAVGEHEGALGAGVVAPTRAEGGVVVNGAEGAEAGRKSADAAHGEGTEFTLHVDDGFAAEDLAFLREGAGVGIKAVFENETHGRAVAEFFRTLERKARTRVLARLHGERIGRFVTRLLGVVIVETRVDAAREGDVGGVGGKGRGGKRNERDERLLEHVLSFLRLTVPP